MDIMEKEEDLEQERLSKKGGKGKDEVDKLRGPEIDTEREQELGVLRCILAEVTALLFFPIEF